MIMGSFLIRVEFRLLPIRKSRPPAAPMPLGPVADRTTNKKNWTSEFRYSKPYLTSKHPLCGLRCFAKTAKATKQQLEETARGKPYSRRTKPAVQHGKGAMRISNCVMTHGRLSIPAVFVGQKQLQKGSRESMLGGSCQLAWPTINAILHCRRTSPLRLETTIRAGQMSPCIERFIAACPTCLTAVQHQLAAPSCQQLRAR